MKIAACLIVRGDSELPQMRKAIASIINYVDDIYITANGGYGNESVEKIKEYVEFNAKTGFNIHYSFLDWTDDYSEQRNFNFSQVPDGYDWIFWMDTDDVLVGGEHLQQIARMAKETGKDAVFLTYWYGCEFNGEHTPANLKDVQMEQNRERLLRPGSHVWKKRLHETPVPVSGMRNNYTKHQYNPKDNPIVVMHTSKEEDLPEKTDRNKRILEKEYEEEKASKNGADPRTLLYLMKIYAELGTKEELEKCIKMGEEYLTKSGWNEERAVCLEQIGMCWGKLGDKQKSVDYFHRAISEWPKQPLIYIRLATAYFNLGNYSFAHHWAELGAKLDIDNGGSNVTNLKQMKVMYSELLTKLYWNGKRDTKKALESAKLLFEEMPTKEHAEQVMFIENFDKLNDACEHVDKLCVYLDAVEKTDAIVPMLDILPAGITEMPFAQKIRQKYTKPRRWGSSEICYFANFGGAHFEKWDMSSLDKGIGGSETAVLQLAKEWADMGYTVTIYGDPYKKGDQYYGRKNGEVTEGLSGGRVIVLPWYYFNPRDVFNIFIQWRVPSLAGKIKVNKFLIDLHDIFAEVDYKDKLDQIDKIMVKSQYHRDLAPSIPDDKFLIIGNGI